MSDEGTKQSQLYKMFLADVHEHRQEMDATVNLAKALTAEVRGAADELNNRIDATIAQISTGSEKAGEAIKVQTGFNLVAAEKLATVLQSINAEVCRNVEQAAHAASAVAKLDIQTSATNAAREALKREVGDLVVAAVGQINTASGELVKKATAAKEEINEAAKSVKWGFARIAGLLVLSGLVASVATLGGAHYLSKDQAVKVAPADPEQAKQMEAGRDFLQVLPQMDDAARNKLIRMIEKNRDAAK